MLSLYVRFVAHVKHTIWYVCLHMRYLGLSACMCAFAYADIHKCKCVYRYGKFVRLTASLLLLKKAGVVFLVAINIIDKPVMLTTFPWQCLWLTPRVVMLPILLSLVIPECCHDDNLRYQQWQQLAPRLQCNNNLAVTGDTGDCQNDSPVTISDSKVGRMATLGFQCSREARWVVGRLVCH